MSKFQIIFIAVFIVCILAGVALFATYKSNNSSTALPTISIWGTFPASSFASFIQKLNTSRSISLSVDYVEKSVSSFDKDFIEALARGQGPDAILVSQDMLTRHIDKVTVIPNTILTERDFKNTYIPQAELYLTSEGALALPFSIDPLVMYWNRDLFTNAGIATVPKFWDEFANVTTKIDVKDVNSNIRRSAIAMGEFVNINHAREILGALLLQAGNPVTIKGDVGIESAIGNGSYNGTESSTPAISFFTQFSDPRHAQYSWNRSLPASKNWFLAGSLATYFGFSSELFDIESKNSNLNFDVAPLPQIRNGKNRSTYASMHGLSIVRSSKDPSATYAIMQILTAPDALSILNSISYLPPVRRDTLATGSTDPYQTIFYDSALISKGWLDINPQRTAFIWKNMIEAITSGRSSVYNAIQTAQEEMDISFQNP